jgi:phage shock protein A
MKLCELLASMLLSCVVKGLAVRLSHMEETMQWVMVALIIGSLVYIGVIILDYTYFVLEVKPLINRFLERILVLEDDVENERREIDMIKDRAVHLRISVGHLNESLEQARCHKSIEHTRRQRLEMVVLKNKLRHVNRMGVP